VLFTKFTEEWNRRFGAIQSNVAAEVTGTYPQSENFMQKSVLQPLADLAGEQLDDDDLELARR
jgi:hypothetical protein